MQTAKVIGEWKGCLDPFLVMERVKTNRVILQLFFFYRSWHCVHITFIEFNNNRHICAEWVGIVLNWAGTFGTVYSTLSDEREKEVHCICGL